MDIKVKKIDSNAVIPNYAKPGDAGLDLTAISKENFGVGMVKYNFGLAFEIPEGYAGFIFPRSSVFKKDLSLTNCVGVIDSGYRGEVSVIFRTHERQGMPKEYEVGDRIAQIIIMPIPKINLIPVQKLQKSDRGSGGFGSTGN